MFNDTSSAGDVTFLSPRFTKVPPTAPLLTVTYWDYLPTNYFKLIFTWGAKTKQQPTAPRPPKRTAYLLCRFAVSTSQRSRRVSSKPATWATVCQEGLLLLMKKLGKVVYHVDESAPINDSLLIIYPNVYDDNNGFKRKYGKAIRSVKVDHFS